jgi:hypothetical protein
MESATPSGIPVLPLLPTIRIAWVSDRVLSVTWALICYSFGWIAVTAPVLLLSFLGSGPPPTLHAVVFRNIFDDDDISFGWTKALAFAAALAIAGSACTVAWMTLISSKARQGRSGLFCVLLGLTVASASMMNGGLVSLYLSTIPSPPAWTESTWFWSCIYAAPGIAASPLIVRQISKPVKRLRQNIALAALAATFYLIWFGYVRFSDSIDQRRIANLLIDEQPDFQRVADWVKANSPPRSVNSNVQLPPGISMPPGGHRIQAILVPNGPVLILMTLYQEISIGDRGPALVYVTSPLRPDQIGHDSQGRPSIRIHEIWDHYIERQISPQIYLVELNQDPEERNSGR